MIYLFLTQGRLVRLFTPTVCPSGRSQGVPLFGTLAEKQQTVNVRPPLSFTSRSYNVHFLSYINTIYFTSIYSQFFSTKISDTLHNYCVQLYPISLCDFLCYLLFTPLNIVFWFVPYNKNNTFIIPDRTFIKAYFLSLVLELETT